MLRFIQKPVILLYSGKQMTGLYMNHNTGLKWINWSYINTTRILTTEI